MLCLVQPPNNVLMSFNRGKSQIGIAISGVQGAGKLVRRGVLMKEI